MKSLVRGSFCTKGTWAIRCPSLVPDPLKVTWAGKLVIPQGFSQLSCVCVCSMIINTGRSKVEKATMGRP